MEDRRDYSSKFFHALSAVGDLKEALKSADLGTKTAVATFVHVFPDVFRLVAPKKGGSSFVELK